MKKRYALIYSLKVWITALILTPIMSYIIGVISNEALVYFNRNGQSNRGLLYGSERLNSFNFDGYLFGNIYYCLTCFTTLLIVTAFVQKQNKIRIAKITLTLIVLFFSIYIFRCSNLVLVDIAFNKQLTCSFTFSILFVSGIWFYKLKTLY